MYSKLYGPRTITVEYIQTILEQNLCDLTIAIDPPPEFYVHDVIYNINGKTFQIRGVSEKRDVLTATCLELFTSARDPQNHVARIDSILAKNIECCFMIPSTRVDTQHGLRSKAEDACQLLRRLPANPPTLPADRSMQLLPDEYYINKPNSTVGDTHVGVSDNTLLWENLRITNWLSTNTVRIALWIVIGSRRIHNTWPDLLSDLLDRTSELSAQAHSDEDKTYWFVVSAALWSCWQSAVLLRHYAEMRQCVKFGFLFVSSNNVYNRGGKPLPECTIHEYSREFAPRNKGASICSWAFELLRNNPVCTYADFREFHQCYQSRWILANGRCSRDGRDCSGRNPEHCLRFKGMKIGDQTVHQSSCDKACRRVKWNGDSYRSVAGSRAVKVELDPKDCTCLNYCAASDNTLVISHVWSHGQGGRPHEGVNLCLHNKYSTLAKDLGCNSYWWDSTCIPEDHQLRQEAINLINKTFYDAKVTLVCDRDIMDIDVLSSSSDANNTCGTAKVLQEPPLSTCEIILSTLVVCDWNVRAWTYLESVRGRRNLHLLCKNDYVVSMKHVIDTIYCSGRLSILALCLTIGHVFPWTTFLPDEKGHDRTRTVPNLNINQAGAVLCYRHASRPGDDMVIWSLLIEQPVGQRTLWAKLKYPDAVQICKGKLYESLKFYKKAERDFYRRSILKERINGNSNDFWRSQIGETIRTGFLISSAPRLQTKGFSWAPAAPACDPVFERSVHAEESRLPSFDDDDTQHALITHYGLIGNWLIHEFYPRQFLGRALESVRVPGLTPGGKTTPEQREELSRISKRYLKGCIWGALIRPMVVTGRAKRWAEYRGRSSGKLVAVLGARWWHFLSKEEEARTERHRDAHAPGPHWHWKGVYDWPDHIELPEFDDTGLLWRDQILIS